MSIGVAKLNIGGASATSKVYKVSPLLGGKERGHVYTVTSSYLHIVQKKNRVAGMEQNKFVIFAQLNKAAKS